MKPVTKTAWFCAGLRMLDAERPNPVCGDEYARRFMTQEGLDAFDRFRGEWRALASNAARCRIIDDMVRDVLRSDPEHLMVLVGAGFDTRAYRLGAGRWVEVDEEALLAFKERQLPAAECPRPLTRLAHDFATDTLEQRLAPWAGTASVTVIVEGVSMYVGPDGLARTLAAVRRVFPHHRLLIDLMTREFSERWCATLRPLLASLGAHFGELVDDPAAAVAALGYRQLRSASSVERACLHGLYPFPRWLLPVLRATYLRSAIEGYRMYEFVC